MCVIALCACGVTTRLPDFGHTHTCTRVRIFLYKVGGDFDANNLEDILKVAGSSKSSLQLINCGYRLLAAASWRQQAIEQQ